jgi:DNA-binding response OmpR family regulator
MVVQPSSVGSPPVVLIVENDNDTRELYETIFKLHGFGVADASTADAALAQATTLLPDLVVTDVGLGGRGDGANLASRIHAVAQTASLPVIAVTGLNRTELSANAEFSEILQKPVLPSELIAAARRVLDLSTPFEESGQQKY